jgi:uncharacterized protein
MTMTTRRTLLDQRSCWQLLRTAEVGRLCYTEAAMPIIRPVPFIVDRLSVVVALSLAVVSPEAFVQPSIVAFEAGEWAPSQQQGWSVQLVGKAEAVPDHEAERLTEQGLTSWMDGPPARYVRVGVGVLSGHRLVS